MTLQHFGANGRTYHVDCSRSPRHVAIWGCIDSYMLFPYLPLTFLNFLALIFFFFSVVCADVAVNNGTNHRKCA